MQANNKRQSISDSLIYQKATEMNYKPRDNSYNSQEMDSVCAMQTKWVCIGKKFQ